MRDNIRMHALRLELQVHPQVRSVCLRLLVCHERGDARALQRERGNLANLFLVGRVLLLPLIGYLFESAVGPHLVGVRAVLRPEHNKLLGHRDSLALAIATRLFLRCGVIAHSTPKDVTGGNGCPLRNRPVVILRQLCHRWPPCRQSEAGHSTQRTSTRHHYCINQSSHARNTDIPLIYKRKFFRDHSFQSG